MAYFTVVLVTWTHNENDGKQQRIFFLDEVEAIAKAGAGNSNRDRTDCFTILDTHAYAWINNASRKVKAAIAQMMVENGQKILRDLEI